jgi:HlyD family secretion protein
MNTNNGNGVKLDRALNGAKLDQLSSLTKALGSNNSEATGENGSLKEGEQQATRHSLERGSSAMSLPGKEVPSERPYSRLRSFEQPVILEQSSVWSRAILWGLMSVTTISIVWACVAQIEEAIPAQGKLEPKDTVKEVQAPVGGVVKAIYVDDGQKVKKGDRLLSFDPTASVAQLASLLKVRTSLAQENQFYQAQMRRPSELIATEPTMVRLGLPAQLMSLVKSRAALTAENQLFRAQVSGKPQGSQLSGEQIERLQSNKAELNSRVEAGRSEVEQLTRQLNQTEIRLASAKDTLAMNQEIAKNLAPLAKEGALSRIQYLKQEQETRTSLSELSQLRQERERLLLEINEAKSKLQNTTDLDRKDLLTKIAENDKSIAEIDSQLTKTILENEKRLNEIDSQISQTKLSLRYEEVTAPSNGTVFDLQAHTPGFVANTSQPLLKIVPDDVLTAKVFITNRDIGFVKEGMNVDVRIDSFPFSEFGDVKGKLLSVGSDALPPDQNHPFYRFPATVQLERQSLLVNGRVVPLQSGMSLNANIKVRSRSVISIFTDLFNKNIESLKFVR